MDLMGMAGFATVFAQVSLTEQWLNWFGSLFGDHALTAIAIVKIIGINIVLSGDNAVVIALACRNLPPRQRQIGILLGAGAAVVLRIIFTLMVLFLFSVVPYLKLVGGLLLFWIAVKLLAGDDHAGEDKVAGGDSLWEAVKIVAIADIVMSLDNVLAIVGAAESAPPEQRIWLIVLGLAISHSAGRCRLHADHGPADQVPHPCVGRRGPARLGRRRAHCNGAGSPGLRRGAGQLPRCEPQICPAQLRDHRRVHRSGRRMDHGALVRPGGTAPGPAA